jgi:hypothetical protein
LDYPNLRFGRSFGRGLGERRPPSTLGKEKHRRYFKQKGEDNIKSKQLN